MGEQQLVSIALCTYNGERFLRLQLDSILNQTYKNIELVIIDDRSTDNTYAILENYASCNPIIKLYQNSENLGFIKNFEKAIEYCSGDLIALADQDDIWLHNKIELQTNYIGDNLLIYHDSEFIDEDGSSMNRHITDVRNFYRGKDNRAFLLENCVSGHSCLFKKQLVEHILPFPTNVFHDWWIAYMALSYGSIEYLQPSLVKYRQHAAANTDILRAGTTKKRDPLKHMRREAERLQTFADAAPFSSEIALFSALLNKRLQQYFCFSLFLTFLKKRDILLFIQKKSSVSKFNFSLKYLWGYKLKRCFKF